MTDGLDVKRGGVSLIAAALVVWLPMYFVIGEPALVAFAVSATVGSFLAGLGGDGE